MAPAAVAAAQAAVAVSDAPSSLPIVAGVARDDVLDAVQQYEVRIGPLHWGLHRQAMTMPRGADHEYDGGVFMSSQRPLRTPLSHSAPHNIRCSAQDVILDLPG
jgi:hypothetical protein